MNTPDINSLINDARCIDKCIPDGAKMAVLILLLSQIAGNTEGGGGGTNNLSGNGSPVGIVTPNYIGQAYTDLTTPGYWTSTGLASSSWLQIA
jgi:hypothetical protein